MQTSHKPFGRKIYQRLRRIARRGREVASAVPRRCERSEAIHSFLPWRDGLLRCARNDGAARWIASRSLPSGAHSRDPLARNDGLSSAQDGLSQRVARMARRGREVASAVPRHCERSEAIHSFFARQDGLLRCARNDDAARWIASRSPPSGAHSRGPHRVARLRTRVWNSTSLRAQRSNPFFLTVARWIASLRSQ